PQINPFTVSQTPSTPAEPNQHMNTDSTQPNPQFESHQNIHTQTNQPNQQTTPTQSTFSNPFAVPPTAPINEPTTTPRNPFVKQQQYPNAPTHTPTYSYKQETFSTVAQQQVLNNPMAATTTVVGVGSTAYHSPQNATPAQIYS